MIVMEEKFKVMESTVVSGRITNDRVTGSISLEAYQKIKVKDMKENSSKTKEMDTE